MLKKFLQAVTGKKQPAGKQGSGSKPATQGRGAKKPADLSAKDNKNAKRGGKKSNQPAKDTHQPAHQPHHAGQTDNKKSQKRGKQDQQRPAIDDTPWSIDDFKVEADPAKTRFHDLDLPDSVMRGIHALGFQYCTPIQAESLPAALRGRDTIGQAQTGTGKSAAFLLTILNRLLTVKPEERFASEPRALVIAPTRELVMQIGKDAEGLAKYTGLNVVTIVGGMDYEKQRAQLRNHVVDVLVATPGRLIDFMRSQDVFLDQVEVLVLDEADRMLDMGFINDINRILKRLPESRQTLFFSATFNDEVFALSKTILKAPKLIEVAERNATAAKIEQTFYEVDTKRKAAMLAYLIGSKNWQQVLIFTRTKQMVDELVAEHPHASARGTQ